MACWPASALVKRDCLLVNSVFFSTNSLASSTVIPRFINPSITPSSYIALLRLAKFFAPSLTPRPNPASSVLLLPTILANVSIGIRVLEAVICSSPKLPFNPAPTFDRALKVS